MTLGQSAARLAEVEVVMMKTLAFGVVVMVGAFGSIAWADCLDSATKALEQRGLTVRDSSEHAMEELAQPANSGTTSYRAWVRVAGCEQNGYVVVNMRPNCAVRDIWTTGACDETPKVLNALAIPSGTERR